MAVLAADTELGEEATHGATPGDLDRAPLGMQMDPACATAGYHGPVDDNRAASFPRRRLDTSGRRQ